MNLDANHLIGPLLGKTATFLVEGRTANIALAGALMSASARSGSGSRVLDLDALYSSNADAVLGGLSADGRGSVSLDVPRPGADVKPHIARLFDPGESLLVVDSLNTFHHVLSRSGRELSFVVKALSVFTRATGAAAVLTMYRREGPGGTRSKGSLSELSDVEVGARLVGVELVLECTRGEAWPGNALTLRVT